MQTQKNEILTTCQLNVFTFNNQIPVRTHTLDGELLFVAKDVCRCLNISWNGGTLRGIPIEWKGMLKLNTPYGYQSFRGINEAALYKLAFRSNKPEADRFTNWVVSEVLPTLRKTGTYSMNTILPKISDIRKEIVTYKNRELSEKEYRLLSLVDKLTNNNNLKNIASSIEDVIIAYNDLIALGQGNHNQQKYNKIVTALRDVWLLFAGATFEKKYRR